MSQQFTILGERCSGTNWLQNLILSNFEMTLIPIESLKEHGWNPILGWKHFFGYKGFDKLLKEKKELIYFCIVRNPIDYFVSFYKNPHHQSKERLKDMETFLLSEFYSIDLEIGDELYRDRKYDGSRYKNIFEMRSCKCKYLLDILPNLVKNYYFIRYEDLKIDPIKILKEIENKFNLKNKDKEYYIEKRYVSCNGINENREYKENYYIDSNIKKIIHDNLDWEIEEKIGYRK